ncbi:cadherin-like domain-containing protein [Celeribacter marinus]|uniref:cadherin-like domain-containing protein n=1 Tax=Celeribacter marinus TaxID=1397108 RepID=UPI0009EC0E42|nr:tandem-95 repeat protein [Celeribacter marinus]
MGHPRSDGQRSILPRQRHDDLNGNGFNGTVVFVDDEGQPTGETLVFTEIEEVRGNDVGRAPDAEDDTASTDEDTPVTINVLGNDTDPDGDDLTVSEATSPNGTVTINPDGTLTFTPDENFNGEAVITYTVTDPDGNEDTATVTVDVAPINDAPDAVDDADTTDEDTAITVDLLANDSDVDGDDLTVVSASVPAEQGTLVDNGDGTVTFTPAPDFNGEATITYTIEDEEGLQDTAVHTITVTPENDAPVAEDDTASTDEDSPVTINVLGNDTDPDGDDLTVSEATSPNGTVTINPDGTLTFTPDENFNGEAVITYTVTDPDGNEDTATVTVDVAPINDAPDAVDDADTTDEDTAITVDLLANDSDVDGDDLTVVSASVPAEQGTLVDNGDGTVTFTPAPDFNGEATITYTIEDEEGLQDTAVHTITVTPENDAPVAEDDTASTDEDSPVTINVLGNDTDPDGDDLTVSEATSPNGTVTINPDGTLTFTPDENFNGEAVITYTVTDPDGNEDTATVTVDVAPINDAPDAVDDADTTDEDTAITVDLLANDSDVDGDDLTVVSASVPAEQGTLVDNGDGTVTFTPAPDFNGEATITYTIEDEEGLQDTAVHTITVTPENDAPVAEDDTASTDEDSPVTINVLGNDTDPDGDDLTVSEATSPNGTVTINPDGTLTFTPDENFNGEAVITYTVTDPDGNEDTATVTVDVAPINDAPDAVDDADTTDEDTAITVDLLANDSDVDGDDLTVVSASVPAEQGTLVDNGDGTVTFTPAPDFNGEATITYTIEDEEGLQDTAVHTITVVGVNEDPEAEDDCTFTNEDTPVTVNLLANDTDPDGDPLTVVSAVLTDGEGTLIDNGDGTVTFEPSPDWNGVAVVTYTVDDGNGGTDTAEHLIAVRPINDAPEAVDDTAETDFNAPVIIDVLDNDTDVDGDDLTVIAATSPDGTVEINPDGTLTFTPTDGFTGEATIDYTIEDEDGLQASAQVSITVGDQPRDGIVEGTSGDDLIDLAYTGDPDGDMIDNNDELLAGEGPNDDIIFGYDGDDTILGGEGDDEIDGGTGDDTIFGEDGDDVIVDEQGSDTVDGGDGDDEIDVAGGDSPDTIAELLGLTNPNNLADLDYSPYSEVVPVDSDPNDDIDTVIGGAGDDTIITGDDADYIEGGDGDDTIYSGIDDDTVFGGDGDDYIEDVQGADYVDGGAGDDTIIVGFDTFSDYSNGGLSDDPKLPSAGYPFLEDQNQIDGKDEVHGGDGDDYIVTGDDADLIYGDDGDDTIKAGIDDDTVYGGAGNDNILGGHGSDYIEGGDGDDYIDASDLFQIMNHTNEDDATDPFPNNDMDIVYGGAGNDTIIGGDDQDMLYGEDGNDIIDGGIDDDIIDGGAGNDILMGGDGDDTITAGEGFDTVSGGTGSDSIYGGGDNDVLSGGDDNDFIYISESQSGQNNTTVNGGAGGLDWDTLDISDMLSNGWVITTQVQNPDSDGNGFDGQIQLYNADDDTYANINYTNIEQVIPCFTPGTMIATPEGERAVESLKVGDKVITRDNGMQTIRWVGAKEMTTDELTKRAELKPILIREGALGQGLPERDMIVSPNHRMLVTSEKAALLFEDYEVLVAAKHLLGREGVEELDAQDVTYIHIMFDRHEVILSDGTWSESFQPGDYTLAGIGEESRTEIFTLFPELRDIATREDYVTARRVLRKHEAALLVN